MCDFHVQTTEAGLCVAIQIEHEGAVHATVPANQSEALKQLRLDVTNCRLKRAQVIARLTALGAEVK